jgi:hypothetical protein
MPTDSRLAFLRRLARGRKRWRELELADMGTAFALDQALAEAGIADKAAPAPTRWAMPRAPWRLWLSRKSGA